ncbi:MAG: outer membrane beta-barrel protein, partial [Gemmatimonadota bacterium]
MTRTIIAMTAIATLLHAGPADAQDRWAFELRASGAVGTQDVTRVEDHQNGIGLDGTLRYRFQPHLAAYVGWDWVHFAAAESIAGPDMDLEQTGYAVGLRFEHPIPGHRTAAWVRAGATYDHLEMENADGEITHDSGHGFGWEGGAGLAVPVGARWSFTPGIRYRSLSRDLEVEGRAVPVELRY